MGYYIAEEARFREITGAVGCRCPLSLLLEASDDIAHLTADTENAVQNWGISVQTVMLQAASDVFYDEIMAETFRTDLLSVSNAAAITQAISGIAQTYIYDNSQILTLEVSAGNILHTLMNHFIPAA